MLEISFYINDYQGSLLTLLRSCYTSRSGTLLPPPPPPPPSVSPCLFPYCSLTKPNTSPPSQQVKCRRQVDPSIYTSNLSAWRSIFRAEGLRGVFFGWSPTFIGYSFQGAGKYGFYEVFKYTYGSQLLPNTNKTLVYLAASASAEFLADIALCPFEAVKVRMQTTLPPYANNLRDGWGKVTSKEGIGGLYKGLQPLWGRQIPYTMVKFATFESTVNAIYGYLGKPKESYNELQQTGVSFLGGYIAGIGCAVISHPADVMVSKLNADRQRKFLIFPSVARMCHIVLSHPLTSSPSTSSIPSHPHKMFIVADPFLLSYSGRRRRQSHVPDILQHRFPRSLERVTRQDRHDRDVDRFSMVDLR